MTDEEKKDVVDETPKDEAQSPAGPVVGEESSSSQAAGEDPTPTPPAGEAATENAETPNDAEKKEGS